MPDIIDEANDRTLMESESLAIEARLRAALIPVGKPGICANCEQFRKRLVLGVCAPCRDDETPQGRRK